MWATEGVWALATNQLAASEFVRTPKILALLQMVHAAFKQPLATLTLAAITNSKLISASAHTPSVASRKIKIFSIIHLLDSFPEILNPLCWIVGKGCGSGSGSPSTGKSSGWAAALPWLKKLFRFIPELPIRFP